MFNPSFVGFVLLQFFVGIPEFFGGSLQGQFLVLCEKIHPSPKVHDRRSSEPRQENGWVLTQCSQNIHGKKSVSECQTVKPLS